MYCGNLGLSGLKLRLAEASVIVRVFFYFSNIFCGTRRVACVLVGCFWLLRTVHLLFYCSDKDRRTRGYCCLPDNQRFLNSKWKIDKTTRASVRPSCTLIQRGRAICNRRRWLCSSNACLSVSEGKGGRLSGDLSSVMLSTLCGNVQRSLDQGLWRVFSKRPILTRTRW